MRDPLCERRHWRVERGRLPISGRAAAQQAWNPRQAGQLLPAILAPFSGDTAGPGCCGAPVLSGRASWPRARSRPWGP